MTDTLHLIIGPSEHGVVQHAELIAAACGHPVLRAEHPAGVAPLARHQVVHVPFTDRLFGLTLDEAAVGFDRVSAAVHDSGAELSVTLHDVPHGDGPLAQRRRALYRSVIGQARGVVVNSRLELSLVEGDAAGVHSLRLAPLPVGPSNTDADDSHPHPGDGPPTVAVLGFVYPDRGYEQVLAALPERARLLAIGRASDGHDDLLDRYAASAPGQWHCTGYVDERELTRQLSTAAVPVAPNRRVTASASINTWLAHGRRPLVPDSPYVRELVAERPGALTVYDPDDSTALAAAIARALDDPASTWLAAGTATGPTIEDAAATYRSHLAACAPPAVIRGRDGRLVVPGNRWDLLAGSPLPLQTPTVSVVIPYFEAQAQLDRTLTALTRQTHPLDRLQIVVADDGSRHTPDLARAGPLAVSLVRQDDRGFRAAQARNLGAGAADGDVLVFLDADTAPEPEFVAELTRLPHSCPDVLAVGRRRHVDLTGFCVNAALDWRAGDDPDRVLPEPAWLREAYERSGDLLAADRRSYRYLISAVLAVPRDLFHDVGGFDERFVGYGGEDWEFAHRCWTAGAVFAHVPTAVAWHDGADWAVRHRVDAIAAKNAETAILATLLPDPDARGHGSWFPYPAVVVRAGPMTGVDLLASARSAFASGADVGFWVDGVSGPHAELVLADPRISLGAPPAAVLARAAWLVDLDRASDLLSLPQLCAEADRHGAVHTPAVRVTASRVVGRVRRSADDPATGEYLFGRHDRSTPLPRTDVNLAGVLSQC